MTTTLHNIGTLKHISLDTVIVGCSCHIAELSRSINSQVDNFRVDE